MCFCGFSQQKQPRHLGHTCITWAPEDAKSLETLWTRHRKWQGESAAKTRGSRRLIHTVVETVGNVYVFFCQHTSHANSKSQESDVFFFHLPCFMLSCHFEPTSKATIMGLFFLYNTARCILTLFLPWNICSRLYDGNHITHYFGEFEGHQNQESPRKRYFFSKLFDNSRIGLVSV